MVAIMASTLFRESLVMSKYDLSSSLTIRSTCDFWSNSIRLEWVPLHEHRYSTVLDGKRGRRRNLVVAVALDSGICRRELRAEPRRCAAESQRDPCLSHESSRNRGVWCPTVQAASPTLDYVGFRAPATRSRAESDRTSSAISRQRSRCVFESVGLGFCIFPRAIATLAT